MRRRRGPVVGVGAGAWGAVDEPAAAAARAVRAPLLRKLSSAAEKEAGPGSPAVWRADALAASFSAAEARLVN